MGSHPIADAAIRLKPVRAPNRTCRRSTPPTAVSLILQPTQPGQNPRYQLAHHRLLVIGVGAEIGRVDHPRLVGGRRGSTSGAADAGEPLAPAPPLSPLLPAAPLPPPVAAPAEPPVAMPLCERGELPQIPPRTFSAGRSVARSRSLMFLVAASRSCAPGPRRASSRACTLVLRGPSRPVREIPHLRSARRHRPRAGDRAWSAPAR
jgi:hypothetical protein